MRLFAGNIGLDLQQLKVTGVASPSDLPIWASDFVYCRRLDEGYTIARRNANIAPIPPDNLRLALEYLPTPVTS